MTYHVCVHGGKKVINYGRRGGSSVCEVDCPDFAPHQRQYDLTAMVGG